MSDLQSPKNVSSDSYTAEVTLNSSAATKILNSNPERIFLYICNRSAIDVFVRFYATAVDNVKRGIIVPSGGSFKMDGNSLYIGEVSAIAVADSPAIHVTEF